MKRLKPLVKCLNCKGAGKIVMWWGAVVNKCSLCCGTGRISRRANYIHRMDLMEVSIVPVPPDMNATIKISWWRRLVSRVRRFFRGLR